MQALFIVIVLASIVTVAYAKKGDAPVGVYDVVATNSCHFNPVGFSAEPFLYQLAPSSIVLATWAGTIEFLADGRVIEFSTGQYSLPGIEQPAGMFKNICQYTSTPNPDGSFTLDGYCDSDDLSGIATGVKDHNAPAIWRVTATPNTILLSSIGTRINVLTNNRQQTLYRICQGHGVGIK